MDKLSQIHTCYQSSENYPDLAKKLSQIGITSYTVEVASGSTLYRFPEGENVFHSEKTNAITIPTDFNKEATIIAIRKSQNKEIDYQMFMEEIAAAGVRFYEATLTGNRKRVTYYGMNGNYEEEIPH